MGFGIVAMFVMVSVWGLVAFIANTLGINTNTKLMFLHLQCHLRHQLFSFK